MFTCEQRDPQPGVNVSAETLETIDARLSFHREMHERKREERRRREGTKERRRDWREGRTVTGRGTSGFVPGAYTIASPWRNNGSWMSHRVQSQSAISRRGISQGNDRFAIDLRAAAIRSPLSAYRSDGSLRLVDRPPSSPFPFAP